MNINLAIDAELIHETSSLRFVVGLKGFASGYDANGNQTSRRVSGTTYTLIYDAESRLVQVKPGKTTQATYTYDGDGNRVKTVVGSTTTTYVGNYLEWTGSTTTMKKYYYAGGQRVAMRQGDGTLYFLLTDHLGSTAITATSGGGFSAEMRYYPWGGTRYTYGTTPTSYRYTGQREAEVGLYYYGARFYDPALGRFVQADTIIPSPGHPIAWDRYAYVANNTMKYVDPSGHGYCSSPEYVPDNECEELDPNGDGVINNGLENQVPIPAEVLLKLTREERAGILWRWLNYYEGQGWWGSDGLSETEIIALILFEEGSALSYADKVLMVRGIRAFIEDNDYMTMLAAMTGFINPDGQAGLTAADLEELINPPSLGTYLDIVDDVFDDPFRDSDRNYKFWFTSEEMAENNVTLETLYELAKAYGGTITQASSYGDGTVQFYFTSVNVVAWCATGSGSCNLPNP